MTVQEVNQVNVVNNGSLWVAKDLGDKTAYVLKLSEGIHCRITAGIKTGSMTVYAYECRQNHHFKHSAWWRGTSPISTEMSVQVIPSGEVTAPSKPVFDIYFKELAKKLPGDVQALFCGNFGIGAK